MMRTIVCTGTRTHTIFISIYLYFERVNYSIYYIKIQRTINNLNLGKINNSTIRNMQQQSMIEDNLRILNTN